MRKDFYIFRHGQTDYNKEHRWQGCGIDVDLNEEGLGQAERLAQKLEPYGLEHIYSSNLQRALHTALRFCRNCARVVLAKPRECSKVKSPLNMPIYIKNGIAIPMI